MRIPYQSMVEGNKTCKKKKRFCFLHLDLGIGGAEQLILNLARASLSVGDNSSNVNAVDIYTTHCDPNHCFQDVKPPDGIFCTRVHVCGAWIPKNFGGFSAAFCSHLRMIYLSMIVLFFLPTHPEEEIIYVVDVLPTPLVFLTNAFLLYWNSSRSNQSTAIFYCHFPDKLLKRDTINGQTQLLPNNESNKNNNIKSILKSWYRNLFDWLEETSMSYADLVCINSNFTLEKVQETFPSLDSSKLLVLHPPIRNHSDDQKVKNTTTEVTNDKLTKPFVSLNRFERKKNVNILLKAYAKLLHNHPTNIGQDRDNAHNIITMDNNSSVIPPLIIAGGYDIHNKENLEHYQELVSLAKDLNIPSSHIRFCKNISDNERMDMLQNALCVCYTPKWEHFGIVPLEAMYAGTPVIAWNCGGPKETVLHKQTGYLVDLSTDTNNDSEKEEILSWTMALQYMIDNDNDSLWESRTKQHVQNNFAWDTFVSTWEKHISKAQTNSLKRHEVARKRLKMLLLMILFITISIMIIIYTFFISHNTATKYQEL